MSFKSVLKKIGGGALMAAPFLPIPGLQALGPLASTMLHAGEGAAGGGLLGGKKGAAIGAGVGSLAGHNPFGQHTPNGDPNAPVDPTHPASPSGLGKFLSGDMGKLLTTGGLGLAEGLLGPKPQVRKGYKGDVDPQKLLSESNARLNSVFGDALKRSQTSPDFSNVRAQTPQGLTGTDPGMGAASGGNDQMAEMLKHLGMLGVKL